MYVYESIFTNNPISPLQLQRRFYPGTAGIALPKKDTQHMQGGGGGVLEEDLRHLSTLVSYLVECFRAKFG